MHRHMNTTTISPSKFGSEKPRLVLFGASEGGLRALRLLEIDYHIVAFTDNNTKLHDTKLRGIPIVAPNELPGLVFDHMVISSQWGESIHQQLLGLGIPPWKISTLEPPALVSLRTRRPGYGGAPGSLTMNDEDSAFLEIWERCAPFTMTSFERGLALYRAVRYIGQAGVPGAFVGCGVWRGGSSMIAMLALQRLGVGDRQFFLFDTFSGMTTPGNHDVDMEGRAAEQLLDQEQANMSSSLIWACADLDQVRKNIASTGYDMTNVQFVQGDVLETLHRVHTGRIALLRLDTVFYQSTLAELDVLYPRLVRHGILLIDDFGHWLGARKAVEEYFGRRRFLVAPPFFHRIDYTGRIATRMDDLDPEPDSRYDYRPPGLADPDLLKHFPTLSITNPSTKSWPYLRCFAPHCWRTDSRNLHDVITGVLSVEEALLLYNNALIFRGKRGIEIGCHLSWSTAHLLAAGLSLDVIDPVLHRAEHRSMVESSLRPIANTGYRLWAGYSPSVIPPIAQAQPEPWSFGFIDGNHEEDSPQQDAETVSRCCAKDACVMFHDLTSPYVARGLVVMRNLGWTVGIYNTMQIMGVAWRGDVRPVDHIMDPAMPLPDSGLTETFVMLSKLE